MSFHSVAYLFFLAVVLAAYWSLPRRGQNILLLGASYVFYGWHHPWFLLPLWASTLIDYGSALGMERWPARRRWFLCGAIGGSIALLVTFKYAGFFVQTLSDLRTALGADPLQIAFRLVLPAGLSFYTFQSIGYVVDVYRRRVPAERNLLQYALYVSFFPQLVAGPIERAAHMFPQYVTTRRFDVVRTRRGLELILWGLFKKVVIADNTATVANKVFALTHPSFPVLWAGVIAFAIQIYADFSGYTDIARGTAKLLGIDLMKNFNHPYVASSPSDFWRRWHISLSTWLRDFIYIPLGGNRGSALRASFTLIATFAISGLWHGASWNFVLWGLYWGLLILLQRALNYFGLTRQIPTLGKIALTLCLTCFGWLLFREHDLGQLIRDVRLSPWATSISEWWVGIYLASVAAFYALPLALHLSVSLASRNRRWNLDEWSPDMRFFCETSRCAFLLLGIVVARAIATSDFIYFQF